MTKQRISVDEQKQQVEDAMRKWQFVLYKEGLCSVEDEAWAAWQNALLDLQIRVVVAAGVPLGRMGEGRLQ